MAQNYDWAVNKLKLNRAIAEGGKGATEADVKALYIKYGGLVRETEKEEVAIEDMTVAQLKKHAKDNGIDLGNANTKAEILAILAIVAPAPAE